MLAVPDTLAGIYLTSFLIGLLFVVLSAVIGLTHDLVSLPGLHHVGDVGAAGHGGDVGHVGHAGHVGDVGHAGHGGHVGHAEGAAAAHAASADGSAHAAQAGQADDSAAAKAAVTASPLNVMTVMAFLTWFGAAGYILHVFYGLFLPFSLVGSVVAGLVGGWLVFLFLVKVLLPGTTSEEYHIVGNFARVTIAIPAGGLGEVVYTMGGSRHCDGARGADGQSIAHGTEVVIVRYEKGIAYVEPWESAVESADRA